MPKGPTKRRPETLARLMDAAYDAFADLGFAGATIPEICRRAGYTHGAFYSNFASKDELFFALFDRHAARVVEQISALADSVPPGTDIPDLVGLLSTVGDDERRWFLVSTEFTLYAIRNPAAAARLAEHDARVRAELARLVEQMLARTGRRLAVDPHLLARFLVAVREGGLAQTYVEPDTLPAGELERAFLPSLLEAASHPSGIAAQG